MAEEKKNWLGPYVPQGNFLREFVQQVKLVYHLMLDPRVHPLSKLIPIAALAYVISPIDFVADVIPVLGQMDDIAVVAVGFRLFLEFAPPDVVSEYLKRLARSAHWDVANTPPPPPQPPAAPSGDILDGDYRVEE